MPEKKDKTLIWAGLFGLGIWALSAMKSEPITYTPPTYTPPTGAPPTPTATPGFVSAGLPTQAGIQTIQAVVPGQVQPYGTLKVITELDVETFGALYQFSRRIDIKRLSGIEVHWPANLDFVYMNSWLAGYVTLAQKAGLYKISGYNTDKIANTMVAAIASYAGGAATAGPAGIVIGFIVALGKMIAEAFNIVGVQMQEAERSAKVNPQIEQAIGLPPGRLHDYVLHWSCLTAARIEEKSYIPEDQKMMYDLWNYQRRREFAFLGLYLDLIRRAKPITKRDTLPYPPLAAKYLKTITTWTLPAYPIRLLPAGHNPMNIFHQDTFNTNQTRALLAHYRSLLKSGVADPALDLTKTTPYSGPLAQGDPAILRQLQFAIGLAPIRGLT